HPAARPGHTANQCACAPRLRLADRSALPWLATPSPAPAARGLLRVVRVWGTVGASADVFLQGLAPNHGVSATLATSFRFPTEEALGLPLAVFSFPEYTRWDWSACLDQISQQSHVSRPPPIHRPSVYIPLAGLFG